MISLQKADGTKANLVLRGIRVGGVNKAIVAGRILDGGVDRQFWDGSTGSLPSLTVSASPVVVSGAIALVGSHPVTTSASTVAASGGSAPYTYAWTLTGDDGLSGGWSALSPASATTQFRAGGMSDDGVSSTASFLCTVTDARGATGTVTVTAVATNYGKV